MRSRVTVIGFGLFLSLILFACSKKTDQTADNSAANPAQSAATSSQPAQAQPAPAQPAPAAPAPPPPIVVPAGTAITMRLAQSVGSKISQAGQSFSGTVAHPVVVGGATAIPAGAKVSGTVIDAKPLGRFAGGASLSLRLNSVDIQGSDVPIKTSSVTQVVIGKGKRTAVLAGGGAGGGRTDRRIGWRRQRCRHWRTRRRWCGHGRRGIHGQQGHRTASRVRAYLYPVATAGNSAAMIFISFCLRDIEGRSRSSCSTWRASRF